jgi:putative endonuclease
MSQANRVLGARGEELVARWYQARGYTVVDRNWRCRDGELDVIVERDGTVVFCEVKTRSSAAFGTGLDAVTRVKQLRIRRLAAQWLLTRASARRPRQVRFDVAAVTGDAIEVVEAAF